MTTGLLFAGGGGPLDYGRRLSRLRWRRAFPGAILREARLSEEAARVLSGAGAWIAVRDETALPLPGARAALRPGRVALSASRGSFAPAAPHTLRELEEAVFRPLHGDGGSGAPAFAFRTEDFPPSPGEPLGELLARLARPPTPREVAPELAVFASEDPSERERPEVVRRVPAGAGRLLDVGCGGGVVGAALKRDHPGLAVEGVERDEAAAARASARLDRVHRGDALEALALLDPAGERYDVFVFADVLEHLPDPIEALALARRLASPGACLVASVPNAGHLSLVRDLARGRFDPVPAGLADASHLRWFTRRSLAEALEEAGWSVSSVESEAGAPAGDAEQFLAHFADWPDLDRESLLTYQWIAIAVLDGERARPVENSHGSA